MNHIQVVWRGPVWDLTGYGNASREYALALDRQGFDVKIETYTWGYASKTIEQSKRKTLLKMINKPLSPSKPKILIQHTPPGEIKLSEDAKKYDRSILNTVWETTKIPGPWRSILQSFNAIGVPCRHNIKVLENSGVTVPVYLVPHGADISRFHPDNEKWAFKRAEGRFVFVSVFDFQHRKNPEALLKAYWEEFSEKDDVLLIIKTYGESRKKILSAIENYKKLMGISNGQAPVIVLAGIISEAQLKGLYTLGDMFVLPTRGEGVGLPFIEALSSGTPVMATGWGGHMDFLNENNAFFINYELKRTSDYKFCLAKAYPNLFGHDDQYWAEADVEDLKSNMRFAYEHPGVCKQKGFQGRKDMLERTWDSAGALFKKVIKDVI
ncbi:MAG: glycosyltransferase family 4 protein [Tuberibacillus sp.]